MKKGFEGYTRKIPDSVGDDFRKYSIVSNNIVSYENHQRYTEMELRVLKTLYMVGIVGEETRVGAMNLEVVGPSALSVLPELGELQLDGYPIDTWIIPDVGSTSLVESKVQQLSVQVPNGIMGTNAAVNVMECVRWIGEGELVVVFGIVTAVETVFYQWDLSGIVEIAADGAGIFMRQNEQLYFLEGVNSLEAVPREWESPSREPFQKEGDVEVRIMGRTYILPDYPTIIVQVSNGWVYLSDSALRVESKLPDGFYRACFKENSWVVGDKVPAIKAFSRDQYVLAEKKVVTKSIFLDRVMLNKVPQGELSSSAEIIPYQWVMRQKIDPEEIRDKILVAPSQTGKMKRLRKRISSRMRLYFAGNGEFELFGRELKFPTPLFKAKFLVDGDIMVLSSEPPPSELGEGSDYVSSMLCWVRAELVVGVKYDSARVRRIRGSGWLRAYVWAKNYRPYYKDITFVENCFFFKYPQDLRRRRKYRPLKNWDDESYVARVPPEAQSPPDFMIMIENTSAAIAG